MNLLTLFGGSIKLILDHGVSSGLVLNPATSFEETKPFMDRIDLLLIMTVHPGFAGQAFRQDVLPKIREARAFIDTEDLAVALQVDGGIKADTAPLAAEAGADILVSGSGIFPEHIAQNLRKIREAADAARRPRVKRA